MNKKLIMVITFLSIFILIGVGYQPIIADESVIDKVTIPIEDNKSIEEEFIIKNINNRNPIILCIFLASIFVIFRSLSFFVASFFGTPPKFFMFLLSIVWGPAIDLWYIFCADCI